MNAFTLAVIAGILAATLATAVKILAWRGFGFAAPDMLLRDAYLAVAIVSAHGVFHCPRSSIGV
jgi:hypothetical protein